MDSRPRNQLPQTSSYASSLSPASRASATMATQRRASGEHRFFCIRNTSACFLPIIHTHTHNQHTHPALILPLQHPASAGGGDLGCLAN